MDKSLYLFENEHGYVTSDGQLVQKDNSRFNGRELANCTEENYSEVVAYYERSFLTLKKYVEANAKVMEGEDEDAVAKRKILLEDEIENAPALGDFEELFAIIGLSSEEETQEPADESVEGSTSEVETEETSETTEKPDEETEKLADDSNEEPNEESEEESEPESTSAKSDFPELPENASDALKGYHELAQKSVEFCNQKDFQVISHELANVKLKWDDVAKVDAENEAEQKHYKAITAKMQEAEQAFLERKAAYQQQRQEKRKNNLENREQLLDKMRNLIKEEKWQSIGEVKSIQRKWEAIKSVPAEEGKKQQAELDKLLVIFEEHKVEILVQKRQKEEDNLAGKFAILDKMKALNESLAGAETDWEKTEKELAELSRQWRKVGRVPKEQSDQIWDKFRALQDDYYDKKFEHNEDYRKELLKNVDKRKKIIKEANELENEEDLALAARKINQLHRRWKKIGNVPKEENDKLWDEFKAASDKFNEVKSENIDVIKEQEQGNLEKKEELIKQAEQVSAAQDWQKGARQMQNLMKQWKEVGPPPRRKASKLWKKFKDAMDVYYNARREHFKEMKSEQKDNLKKKKDIITKIKELGSTEDAQQAIKEVKELQQQFNEIGFVPIKLKDKVYKEYKEACDVIYQQARAESGNLPGTRHMEFSEGVSADEKKEARLKQVEIISIKKELEKLNEEILHHSDMKTFIKPNKGGKKLIEELDAKIDKAAEKSDQLKDKMKALKREVDKVQE